MLFKNIEQLWKRIKKIVPWKTLKQPTNCHNKEFEWKEEGTYKCAFNSRWPPFFSKNCCWNFITSNCLEIIIHPVAQSGNLFSEKVCKDILHLLWLRNKERWIFGPLGSMPFYEKRKPSFLQVNTKVDG
jgi:hypothetical protein